MYLVLPDSIVPSILDYLGCQARAPTLRHLNRLIQAYLRRVPWESVSRIVKRHTAASTAECPRWPEEFWRDAMQYGFGGTCFESSLAFYSLLVSLGYEGYLTVNDMGDKQGCHAAIIALLEGHKFLVDVTIPMPAALRIDPHRTTRRVTNLLDYSLLPVRSDVYQVLRSHHPNRNAFTLIDKPVSLTDYRAVVENDYTEAGFFLKSVVMVRVIDGRLWRFFSDHRPFKIEAFSRAGKREIALQPEVVAQSLSRLFQLPEDPISAALSWIPNTTE
jgi:arylamine N-acetyltransferase